MPGFGIYAGDRCWGRIFTLLVATCKPTGIPVRDKRPYNTYRMLQNLCYNSTWWAVAMQSCTASARPAQARVGLLASRGPG